MLARGYVDHFLAEVARTQEGHYTDQQLIVTLIDFFTGETLSSLLSTLLSLTFTGGSGTMSKTLAFAFFYCLKCPDILLRVQEEIDRVTGGGSDLMMYNCDGCCCRGQ